MQWIVEPKMDIVERLNTVREGMEAGLDDWPIASQIYEYKTAAAEITTFRKRVAAQAAVIEQLTKRLASTNIIMEVVCAIHPDSACAKYELAENMNALAIPTDSTQILAGMRRTERERVAQMFEESGIGGDHLAAAIRAME